MNDKSQIVYPYSKAKINVQQTKFYGDFAKVVCNIEFYNNETFKKSIQDTLVLKKNNDWALLNVGE